ncbi:MAG TPA: SUMF1/EgtB/PvdO family nonheme iron enzyme, partial [Petrotogaceae bacterium]|nr:SUMF1/EgtB/PvdO family nonheme iron enzyme [Petrotogaceae bacterium]
MKKAITVMVLVLLILAVPVKSQEILQDQNIEMVLVEKGSFEMGDVFELVSLAVNNVHTATFTYDFYIGKYEVTFDQYDRYCQETKKATPDDNGWGRGSRPVINVSWYDAIAYCNWLSEKEGLAKAYDETGTLIDSNGKITTDPSLIEGYRLPTEAEWEYAARGGNKSKGYMLSGSDNPDDVAWYGEFFITGTTHEVGTKQPNELGIYDMSGNVSEWCNDEDPYNTSSSGVFRITRGGYWCSSTDLILNYYRWHMYSGR